MPLTDWVLVIACWVLMLANIYDVKNGAYYQLEVVLVICAAFIHFGVTP